MSSRRIDLRTKRTVIEKAKLMRADGASWLEVAGATGVNRTTIYRWVNPVARDKHLHRLRTRHLGSDVGDGRWMTRPPYYEFLRRERERRG